MTRQETMARVSEVKKQLIQLRDEHHKSLDASDWATCMKLQEQIARKMDEVKALMQQADPL